VPDPCACNRTGASAGASSRISGRDGNYTLRRTRVRTAQNTPPAAFNQKSEEFFLFRKVLPEFPSLYYIARVVVLSDASEGRVEHRDSPIGGAEPVQ
jgi:hypothetical protein